MYFLDQVKTVYIPRQLAGVLAWHMQKYEPFVKQMQDHFFFIDFSCALLKSVLSISIFMPARRCGRKVVFHSKVTYYWYGLTLDPALMSNHMSSKAWDKITYSFPNFNVCAVKVWEWIRNFIQYFIVDVIIYARLNKS